jgi:hypothetical protein
VKGGAQILPLLFALLLSPWGCAALSGLDDKTADLSDRVDAHDSTSPGEEDAARSPIANADGASDGAAASPGTGEPDAPASSTRIRNITFEDKALIHPTSGFDSTFGGTQLLSQSPIGGAYSMLVDGVGAWGTVSFPAVTDLYVTLRLRLDPAGATGDARFIRITHAGGTSIEAFVRSAPRDLVVAQGSATIASFPNLLTDGTIYRFELRVRSAGNVTARLSQGGTTSSVGGNATIGASSKVEIGALSGGTIRGTFDDIGLDSAVQP